MTTGFVSKRSAAAKEAAASKARLLDTESGSVAQDTEQIARLAYSYWEARGCQGGSPREDWLVAEGELRAERTAVEA
ncbi:DUF2934 domain-containing protein [Paludibaculum fermentans]|uniref:DUF2934 domain-containing protein n=1 Tax=Paludibaculum fermentans TaxID=1473598 RepID=UPI003EB79E33